MDRDPGRVPGELHHWLPAAYLARFSPAPVRPRRKSIVSVLWRGQQRANRARVETLTRQRGLYGGETGLGLDLERNWWAYEEDLPRVVDDLSTGALVSGGDWLHVLVPLVTTLLVRGPEFEQRFDRRIESQGGYLGADRMPNVSRLMEIQRFLAVVMVCRWTVAHSSVPLIANDIGWTSAEERGDEPGVAVPLDPRHVLVVAPTQGRRVLDWDGRRWLAVIEREELAAGAAIEWNRMTALRAQRLVLGADESDVEPYDGDLTAERREYGDPFPTFGGRLRIMHEFEWYRCAAAARRRPEDVGAFKLDFAADLGDGWRPAGVMLPTNLPEFATGLSLESSSIWLRFTEAQGFTVPPYWPSFGPGPDHPEVLAQ
jgi:hypothetical protein